MTSTYKLLEWPDQIGITFFLLFFILTLAPYMSGADFGIFRIPTLAEKSRKRLKYVGPCFLILSLIGFFPLWPSLKLPLVFELTNNSDKDISIHPWCDIDVYESEAGGGIKVAYPSYSLELQPVDASGVSSYNIAVGKTRVFKTRLPIERGVRDLYERSAGTIQISFFDRNRNYLEGGAWKLSKRLKNISTLSFELRQSGR